MSSWQISTARRGTHVETSLAQVKLLPSERSQKAFDESYEAAEVKFLRESRIVITTCTTAA